MAVVVFILLVGNSPAVPDLQMFPLGYDTGGCPVNHRLKPHFRKILNSKLHDLFKSERIADIDH